MTNSPSEEPLRAVADLVEELRADLSAERARAEAAEAAYLKSYELGSKWRTRAEAAESERDALREALRQADHTLSVHGHIDAGTELHQRIAAAIRTEGGENGR